MRRARNGFTLIELMVVLVLVGGLTALALPKAATMREQSNIKAAKQQLAATIASARAAAVQKGTPARFRVSTNSVTALVPNAPGDTTFVIPARDLNKLFGVTVSMRTPSVDSVLVFEPRGFVTPRLNQAAMYIVTSGTRADTICVGIIGQIMTRSCLP